MRKAKTKRKARPPGKYSRDLNTSLAEMKANYDQSAKTQAIQILEQIRDLEGRLAIVEPQRRRWPTALFYYTQHVKIVPLNGNGRIVGLYMGRSHAAEYDVRYFHKGEACSIRVFEDELEAIH